MRLRVAVVGFAVLVFGLLATKSVHACECAETSPCQMIRDASAVFIGRVMSVGQVPNPADTLFDPDAVGHFQIEKIYKGLSPGQQTVDVTTSTGCCACGAEFTVGEVYLVNADRGKNGGLGTNYCSRTKRLAQAADDIVLMESFLSGKRMTAILGTVSITRHPSSRSPERLDVSVAEGMDVDIKGDDGKSYKARVDRQGMFRVWDVPEGNYTIRPALSPAYDYSPEKISIRQGACSADAYVFVNALGSIRGRILDSRGRPVAVGTVVSLFVANADSQETVTLSTAVDANGKYQFDDVAPAQYFVAVGNAFYGGASRSGARVIDLRSKRVANGIDIRLEK